MKKSTMKRIQKIVYLSINAPHEKADIFIEWAPHANLITVRIFKGGWEPDYQCNSMQVYLDEATASFGLSLIIDEIEEVLK